MYKIRTKEPTTCIKENESLRSRVDSLVRENARLQEEVIRQKRNLKSVQDYFSYEIINYFIKCNRLRETADQFGFENVSDCYDALEYYCGSSYSVQHAHDYIDCYKEIFGWEYEEDTDATSDCTSETSSNRDSCDFSDSE